MQCLIESSLTAKRLVNRICPLPHHRQMGVLLDIPRLNYLIRKKRSRMSSQSLPLECMELPMRDRNIIVPKVQISDASSFIMSR
jgi:hypothetical protein